MLIIVSKIKIGPKKKNIKKGGIYNRRLQMVKYNEPPYSMKYPHLANYWDDNPALPKRNPFSKNIFYKVKETVRFNKDWLPFKEDNWVTEEDPGFVDAANGDFMLKEAAKAFEKIPGIQSIPFYKIGVQKRVKD